MNSVFSFLVKLGVRSLLGRLGIARKPRRSGLPLLGTVSLGVGVGAVVMYALDPVYGNRRRARARGRVVGSMHGAGNALAATARDVRNRGTGAVAEARHLFGSGSASDEVLVARIRAALGRAVSHPHAIDVTAEDGRVIVSGPVLAYEEPLLLSTIRGVRGVRAVESLLEIHRQPGQVPGLQGGTPRTGARSGFARANWSPTTRLVAGVAGGALVALGVRRGGAAGTGLGALGVGLLARGLTNLEVKRMTGVGAGRRAVNLQKTLHVSAPVEDVFGFWSNYQNFPLFMRNVRNVEDRGNGRSRWSVLGPAGTTVHWDAEIVEWREGEAIAWQSLPGAAVENEGVIRFIALQDGTTRVDVHLGYNPPAGAIGHAVASLFGADPKSEMDEDLLRMKTMIETGNPPRDAADPLLSQAKAVR